MDAAPRPRECHLRKWPDFNGYGFNLHAEKGKAGQYIGSIDPQSPSDAAGLRPGDRIVEVNGVNIGSENHQQVVQRIKAVATETRLLVVDAETDTYFRGQGAVVRGDGDVIHLETPLHNPYTSGRGGQGAGVNGGVHKEIVAPPPGYEPVIAPDPPRLCVLRRWPDFDGFGFNLHSEKGKPGQFIGKVDDSSPSTAAGLRRGDWIVEVNGADVTSDLHPEVVTRIKVNPNEVAMLVVSEETQKFYRDRGLKVTGGMPGVVMIECPRNNPNSGSVNGAHSVEDDNKSSQGYSDTASVGRESHTSADTSQYEGRTTDRMDGGHGAVNQAILQDAGWKYVSGDPIIVAETLPPASGARSSDSSHASSGHSSRAPSDFAAASASQDPASSPSYAGRDMADHSPRGEAASGYSDGAASGLFQAASSGYDAASSGYASGSSAAAYKSDSAKSPTHPATTALPSVGYSAPLPSYGSQSAYTVTQLPPGVEQRRPAPTVPPGGAVGGEKTPPVMVGGLQFASSAKEARERMSKKRDEAKMANMTLKDKYDLLQKL